MNIQRTFNFTDSQKVSGNKLEVEISNIVDAFNNHNGGNMAWDNTVWRASDGRYFLVRIGYQNDGITPFFVFQEVTYP